LLEQPAMPSCVSLRLRVRFFSNPTLAERCDMGDFQDISRGQDERRSGRRKVFWTCCLWRLPSPDGRNAFRVPLRKPHPFRVNAANGKPQYALAQQPKGKW